MATGPTIRHLRWLYHARFRHLAATVALATLLVALPVASMAPPLRVYARVEGGNRALPRLLRQGLRYDQQFRFAAALGRYKMLARMGHCGPKTRCNWHYLLTERVLHGWSGRILALSAAQAASLAVDLANKALAIRVDLGRVAPELEQQARHYYELAVLLDPRTISPRLGIVALFAEQGKRALALRQLKTLQNLQGMKPLDLYNVAYVYAALQLSRPALSFLRRALQSNCKCADWARTSDDFRHIKRSAEFRQLLGLPPLRFHR